jgi:hypothetical protein
VAIINATTACRRPEIERMVASTIIQSCRVNRSHAREGGPQQRARCALLCVRYRQAKETMSDERQHCVTGSPKSQNLLQIINLKKPLNLVFLIRTWFVSAPTVANHSPVHFPLTSSG